MKQKTYIDKPVAERELRRLTALAEHEKDAFFDRVQTERERTRVLYQPRFVAAALCQGAALQFLGHGYGVNDFDIHLFYRQHPDKPQLSRSVYSQITDVGSFPQIKVDFVRTVVPVRVLADEDEDPVSVLRRFLDEKPTTNARKLQEKAVVGLLPSHLFGCVIWPKSDAE